MQPEWLKLKRYPHIGKPLKSSDIGWIKAYVTNPGNIIRHKFTPLLNRVITQRKFRPKENAPKNKSGKRLRTFIENKKRKIYFPSHLDSIIYSYYNYILSNAYEKYLSDKDFSSAVVAYRKIPKNSMIEGNKCNIEFAADAFQFITNNKHRKLSVIIADVSSFFDNLDHRLIHQQWKEVLGVDDLPKDHYKIYKSLVDYKYVKECQLFNHFKNRLIVERNKPNDTKEKVLKRKRVGNIHNMRHENVVSFCYAEEFFKEATHLIKVNKPFNKALRLKLDKEEKKGIPQGTPLSATLANIYMIEFDAKIHEESTKFSRNAFYQRYSDDIIIICDLKDEIYFEELIRNEITKKAHLQIQESKTNIYRYELTGSSLKGGIVKSNNTHTTKQLEYLGFVFDGERVLVKSSGFSRFFRNMKHAFKKGTLYAKKTHIPSNALFERRLYKRFTHIGAKRKLKYIADPNNPDKFKKTTMYDWGNYISYLNKANAVMKEINKTDCITKQARKIWKKFHALKRLFIHCK